LRWRAACHGNSDYLERGWGEGGGGRYPSIDAQPASGFLHRRPVASCRRLSRVLRCRGRASGGKWREVEEGGCAAQWSGQRRQLDHVRRTRLSPFWEPVWGENAVLYCIPRIHSLKCPRISIGNVQNTSDLPFPAQ